MTLSLCFNNIKTEAKEQFYLSVHWCCLTERERVSVEIVEALNVSLEKLFGDKGPLLMNLVGHIISCYRRRKRKC